MVNQQKEYERIQRDEVTDSGAGLSRNGFLSCTKYISCSTGCFPGSNCSIYIFIKPLDYTLTGICVLFRSGYVVLHMDMLHMDMWCYIGLFQTVNYDVL